MKKALIIVDAQYDFFEVSKEDYEKGLGGALAVPKSPEIIPIINKLIPHYDLIIFTKDWHTSDNLYFASQHTGKNPFDQIELHEKLDTLWPDHCVQNTRGADIHEDIDMALIKGDFYIIKKGYESNWHPYSAFGDRIKQTELNVFLKGRDIEEVDICGLALDFCVQDTAIDAATNGFKTNVIKEGSKPIYEDITPVLNKFENHNINYISIEDVL